MIKFLFVLLDITSQINGILSDYGVPIIAFMILIGAGIGFVMNFDKIIDKDGQGTRKEGIINMIWIIGYVIIGLAVIATIVSLVGGLDLRI